MTPTSSSNANGKKLSRSILQSNLLTIGQVARRLGVAFGLLIALLLTIGDLGLRRMEHVNADLRDKTGIQWTKLRLSREAVTYSNRNSHIIVQIFLLKDRQQIDALLADRSNNTQQISRLIEDLQGLCTSHAEKKLLDDINGARQPYIDSYQRALDLLVDKRSDDEAIAVLGEQTTPALVKYQAAWDDFVSFQGNQLELAAQQSGARDAEARRLALLMILLAVVVAAAIALWVIRDLVREMTERLLDEKDSLRTAHQEAEMFINAVPSILIGVDHNSIITRWNSAAAAAFNLSGPDVIGKALTDCGIRWVTVDLHDEIQSWVLQKDRRRCELQFDLNGETRLLGVTITPVHMADQSVATLVIGSDITNQRALEGQLRQAQKLESVGQLAAGIAHEINTPTQYIGDNVRFLKDSFADLQNLLASYERMLEAAKVGAVTDEIIQDVMNVVQRSDTPYLLEEIPKAIEQTIEGIARVSRLVSAMKEFSHPGTKEKIALDLNHAIESTITVARNEWKYVADMETDFDASMPLISCLPGEFNQVILNLLINAVHAITDVVGKGGSEKGTIKVQTRNHQDWVEIRVQDTGTGIPEAVQSRIFDPFFTTKEIGKGTGQGLAIARSVIVDKHNGKLSFETEQGKGTTFIVRLPHEQTTFAKMVTA
ncbi:MAG: ATP-binding protein [Terriglobales bacterium]